MIEDRAHRLAAGTDPGIVPERFLIGAARFAVDNKLADPEKIKEEVLHRAGAEDDISLELGFQLLLESPPIRLPRKLRNCV